MKNLVIKVSVSLLLVISACQEDDSIDQTIDILSNTTQSLPAFTCNALVPEFSQHAMWLGKYKDAKSGHFFFLNESGSIDFFEDSSAHITGTVYLPDKPGDKWHIDIWLSSPKSWADWEALGRDYKGDADRVGDSYKNWTYYIFDNSERNTLIGSGINVGDTLELRQYPYDLEYGLQIGYGANDKNKNFGLSVWFTYWRNGKLYEGDFNFDLKCPNIPNDTNGVLAWPIDCVPGVTCFDIGYPDINETGTAFNCEAPGYFGHQGTDISIPVAQQEAGVDVYAAAAGVVQWVFDGKYDNCPDNHPDCYDPPEGWFEPGQSNGYRVCTELGDYCDSGDCCCFWCFDGGNVVVIRHDGVPGLFATRYDHFKTNSILVKPGERVAQGQKIGEVGSAGNSTGPHLHFEVWGDGFYKLVDPWVGDCGPNTDISMWINEPPWDS